MAPYGGPAMRGGPLQEKGNRRSVKPQAPTPTKPAARAAARQPVRHDISISDVPGLSDDRMFARPEKSFAQPDTMSSPSYHSEESEVAERIRLLELRLAESQRGGQQQSGFDAGYGRGSFGGGAEVRASGEGEKGAHKFMSGLATMHRGTGGANELQAAYEKKLQYQRELDEQVRLKREKQGLENSNGRAHQSVALSGAGSPGAWSSFGGGPSNVLRDRGAQNQLSSPPPQRTGGDSALMSPVQCLSPKIMDPPSWAAPAMSGSQGGARSSESSPLRNSMFMSSLRELKAGPSPEQLSAAQLKRQQLIADLDEQVRIKKAQKEREKRDQEGRDARSAARISGTGLTSSFMQPTSSYAQSTSPYAQTTSLYAQPTLPFASHVSDAYASHVSETDVRRQEQEELAALKCAQAHAQEAHLAQMLESLRAEQAATKARGALEAEARENARGARENARAFQERGVQELGARESAQENEIQAALRALRVEQAAMKERFSSQEDTIVNLQREAAAAARERDEARQQLERVQRGRNARPDSGTSDGSSSTKSVGQFLVSDSRLMPRSVNHIPDAGKGGSAPATRGKLPSGRTASPSVVRKKLVKSPAIIVTSTDQSLPAKWARKVPAAPAHETRASSKAASHAEKLAKLQQSRAAGRLWT
ncbi:hypothetical protein KFL_001330280 [Klebsormidium nitens]|uniref:Uncharacterized protein n=1 Tax=Klebsormidium nitens TaxID=105231 RepID=A0A0U9HNN9_KLENI|nr:hypothetical protein KFL_001330280 [Klebsormidium nitens]|eukprot:GAQ83045.1 hypothetical protein KFL_001330280 [Klebsormidium nitens]